MKHDEQWLSNIWSTRTTDEYNCGPADCKAYCEHMNRLRHIDEWHEDVGDAIWHIVPIVEPPIVTSPLSSDWDDRYTHFQLLHNVTKEQHDKAVAELQEQG